MTRRQYTIAGAVGAAVVVVAVVITLIVTSGGNDNTQSVRIGGSTTSSSAPATTSTSLPATTSTTQRGTAQTTPTTVTPGTTVIIPPRTSATTRTTRPTSTTHTTSTTRSPTTTTTRVPSEVGITNREIRVAVIADDATAFEGMTAWKRAVNARGGIARRMIRLDLLQTNGTVDGYAEAVVQACQHDFAVVGSFSEFDSATDSLSGCGIPDLPARIVNDGHRNAPNTYAVIPEGTGMVNVGPLKWLDTHVAGCCRQYVVVPKDEPGRSRTQAQADAAKAAGITEAGRVDAASDATAGDYAAFVVQLKAEGATLAWSGLGADSTLALRRAAATGGAPGVKAWYCDEACATAAFAGAGSTVDGEYVSVPLNTYLTDRGSVGALRTYVKSTTAGGASPTIAGLESYAAGLLFEQEARSVVAANGAGGLTRVRLLAAVAKTTAFTAKGILGSTDVAGRKPTGCFAMLQVRRGHFARVAPPTAGTLDCSPGNLLSG